MLIQIARLMKNCDNDGGNEVIAVDRRYGLVIFMNLYALWLSQYIQTCP